MAGIGRMRVAVAGLSLTLAALSLALSGCGGLQLPSSPSATQPSAPPPAASAPPSSIPAASVVGRWGFAAYHKEADRGRTEVAARGQCGKSGQPYVIGAGQSGGIMMHLADQAEPQELRLKGGPGGKSYIGPDGPAADAQDREVVSFNGQVLVLRWIDPEIAGRYGTGVYVRCGGRA
jgi:hypothetical protein